MRSIVLLCLLCATAAAAPNKLRRPSTAKKFGDSFVQIEKPGEGRPPEDADEVTYRYETFKNLDPAQRTHEEKTRRMLEDGYDRIRENLLVMKPGEVRWLWFKEQDYSLCDHSGCSGGPDDYAARLEFVSVTRHADELPDDMHITGLPYFGVRRGKTWAALPGERIDQIHSARLRGEVVVIDTREGIFGISASRPGPTFQARHTVSVSSLRARLADEEGLVALRAKKWKVARERFAQAVKLDPSLNRPHLHLAVTQAHLREAPVDLSVMQRDPPGLYWKIMADDTFKVLRTNPAVRALVAKTPGTTEAIDYRCQSSCMMIDPTGRFVVAYASTINNAEFGLSFGALHVIDLKARTIVSTIPLDDGEGTRSDGTHCRNCKRLVAAQKMLTDLGFTPVKSAPVSITQLGRDRPLITFPDAGLQLGRAGDKQPGTAKFLEITPPDRFVKILAAELFDSLVIYRWSSRSTTNITLVPY